MRIVSLLPSATEIVCALGGERALVGVSHECDYPAAVVAGLPRLTRSAIGPDLPAHEIDALVAARSHAGEPIYEVDAEGLARVRPDVVVTQAVCDVCAVSEGDVRRIASALPHVPEVVTLGATSLAGVFSDVRRVASAMRAEARGEALVAALETRLAAVDRKVSGCARPRVVALEWLDPPFAAGHWVPEMVARAGGEEVLGRAGERSFRTTWEAVSSARPDVLVAVPCGYDRAAAERALGEIPRSVAVARVHALDASAHFSRPGPRLVEGVEALAALLHG